MELIEHAFQPGEQPGTFTCPICCNTWPYIPKWKCPGVPQYAWGEAPEHLMNERQLHEHGLRLTEGQSPEGCIWYHTQGSYIWLYDKNKAVPRPPATPAQLAALEKARAALTCQGCGKRQKRATRLKDGYCHRCYTVIWARVAVDPAHTHVRFVDTETTGLDETDQVIEIAITDNQGNILVNSLVRPDCPIPADASAIHGIHDADVAEAPTWSELWPQVFEALNEMVIIGYNVEFDARLVDQTRRRYKIEPNLKAAQQCAMEAYRHFEGARRNCSLTTACWGMGVPAGGHRALGDTQATLGLVRALARVTLKSERPALEDEFDIDTTGDSAGRESRDG